MLSKIIKRTFSSGGFNVLSTLNRIKSAIQAPVKHIKRNIEATPNDYTTMTNTTEEAFDEVSHEWQTLVGSNPFDLNVFNYLENVQTSNFGTVDNPLVVFSSEVPFRYVGCTGQANEDDYEGHELLIFMLREGSLQRCPSCGQVFKLVRLRNEYSPEMDYYAPNFHPYEVQEMGESDTTISMTLFKFNTHFEPTQFEAPSNNVYHMINPDEHDRLLTDPAYRLEKTKAVEEKMRVYVESLNEIEAEFVRNFGPLKRIPMNPVDYRALIDCEKAILKLDRQFRKVSKFQNRQFTDPANHERRQKRLQERQAGRWDNNYAFFYGNNSEEEQQYRDYFETDLENNPENEGIESKQDLSELLSHPEYNLNNYDFQESFTRNPEDDQSSLIEKKAFKFRFRQANNSIENHTRRNNRMISRQIERFQKTNIGKNIEEVALSLGNLHENTAVLKELDSINNIVNESVQLYKDYYESDKEEDFNIFDNLTSKDQTVFLSVFENNTISPASQDGFVTVPKRRWENAFGLWNNFYYDFNELRNRVIPKAKAISNNAALINVQPLTKEELEFIGVLPSPANQPAVDNKQK